MSTADAWTYPANDGAHRPDDGWSQRTRYGFFDIVTLLWRQRWLMAGIFISITALGLAYALTLKPEYTANSTIYVKLGQEDVYQPPVGDAGRGAVPGNEAVVGPEVEVLKSPALRQRVIERIGLAALYPKIKPGVTPEEKADAMAHAVAAMGKALDVGSTVGQPTIQLSFKHENPDMAARALNTLVDEYKVYRGTVFLNSNPAALLAQKTAAQQQLDSVNSAYQAFLAFNHIGDFDADKAAYTQVLNDRTLQRSTITSNLQDATGRQASLATQMAAQPREVVSQRDQNVGGSAALDQLNLDKAKALTMYKEGSPPVADIEAKIADLQAALAAMPALGDTARRTNTNPVYQAAQSSGIDAASQAAGLRASLATVNSQIDDANQRLQQLSAIEPAYRSLADERKILEDSVSDFTRRAQESTASNAIAQASPDNIRVVSQAVPPIQGSSKRKLVAMLAIALAAFTAICAGLLNVFLRPGLPTAAAAGRTLDLPVLATARVKR